MPIGESETQEVMSTDSGASFSRLKSQLHLVTSLGPVSSSLKLTAEFDLELWSSGSLVAL